MIFPYVWREVRGQTVSSQIDRHSSNRQGFSLLEVMLATAMLAASALVLSSLLGLGAKFGSRAESRTEALSLAQSLLDEFLALPIVDDDSSEEQTGELPTSPPRSYRIRVEPVSKKLAAGDMPVAAGASSVSSQLESNLSTDFPNAASLSSSSSSSAGFASGSASSSADGRVDAEAPQRPRQLMLVTVEVFESTPGLGDVSQVPLCQLYRLVRY